MKVKILKILITLVATGLSTAGFASFKTNTILEGDANNSLGYLNDLNNINVSRCLKCKDRNKFRNQISKTKDRNQISKTKDRNQISKTKEALTKKQNPPTLV